MSNFDNFLKKMMGESNEEPIERKNPNPTKPQMNEGRERTGGTKKKFETPRPETKPSPRRVEEDHYEDEEDDDIVERAFQYAATFSKIIKKNFPNNSDRSIVLRSVRAAINIMLGDEVITHEKPTKPQTTQPQIKSEPMVMPDFDEDEDPYEILKKSQMSRLPDNYNPNSDINIKTTYNERGEAEVDLSSITNEDIMALRVLSGIDNLPGQNQEAEINE